MCRALRAWCARNPGEEEVRHRLEAVAAALVPTYGLTLVGLVYVALSWDRPHRLALVAIFIAASIAATIIERAPLERVIRSAWREPFFLAWSLLDLGLIALGAAADGGVTSAFTLVLFFPLVFASLAYPLVSVAVVYATTLGLHLALALAVDPPADAAYTVMAGGSLVLASFIGLMHARSQGRHRDELARIAESDPLTGLLNHTTFHERLDLVVASAAATGTPVTVVALDVDRFKHVNDEHGHATGDAALRAVADVLGAHVRGRDLAGRVGGDEFMLALVGTGLEEADEVVGRLRRAIAQDATGLTVSAGLAGFPAHAATHTELMRLADGALYWSKRRGRDRQSTHSSDGADSLATLDEVVRVRRDGLVDTVHALALARARAARRPHGR